jgi:hypothetical protein
MNKALGILQGILDRHHSRVNQGLAEPCQCEDCTSVRRAMGVLTNLQGDLENAIRQAHPRLNEE